MPSESNKEPRGESPAVEAAGDANESVVHPVVQTSGVRDGDSAAVADELSARIAQERIEGRIIETAAEVEAVTGGKIDSPLDNESAREFLQSVGYDSEEWSVDQKTRFLGYLQNDFGDYSGNLSGNGPL